MNSAGNIMNLIDDDDSFVKDSYVSYIHISVLGRHFWVEISRI